MVIARTVAMTGGSGFLGQHVVREARRRGHAVRLLGRQKPDGAGVGWALFDLDDQAPLDPAVLAGVDAIVHLAAYIPRDQRDPAEAARCFDRNALGTLRLVIAARAAGVPQFLHTVSANAYAPGIEHPTEAAQMLPWRRGTFYLASKVAQETFAAHAAQGGPVVAALRLSTVYGPGEAGGVIPSFARTLLAGERLPLFNGGRHATDWVEVSDVVSAIFLILDEEAGGAFNVGSGIRVAVRDVAELIAGQLGTDKALIEPMPIDDPSDPGFPALDIARLRALGFAPAPVAEGLARVLPTLAGVMAKTGATRS